MIRFPQAPRPKAASSGPPWLALIVTALALVPLSQGAAAPTPAKPRANLDASAGPMVGDASMPAFGSALYYLVRAENACPAGQGPLGFGSDGTPRQGIACP